MQSMYELHHRLVSALTLLVWSPCSINQCITDD